MIRNRPNESGLAPAYSRFRESRPFDPDVMVVGEIRDEESNRIAIEAADAARVRRYDPPRGLHQKPDALPRRV